MPYLAAMDSVPATLRIGIHIRLGDSAVANTLKKGDKRYASGYDWRELSAASSQGMVMLQSDPAQQLSSLRLPRLGDVQ